jgi:hypothetical protein
MENVTYVTYNPETGKLTGCYSQAVHPEHADNHIVLDGPLDPWVNYCANAARDGVELLPVPTVNISALKVRKSLEINAWRAAANMSTFPHAGKLFACDSLSRSDIDGVANHISLLGTFPQDFPGAWKAVDNTYLPLPDIEAFKAMYSSMTTQGTANFTRSQELKALLEQATTPEEISALMW